MTGIFVDDVVERSADSSHELCPRLDLSFVGTEDSTTRKPKTPTVLVSRKAVRCCWPPIRETIVPMHLDPENVGDGGGRLDCSG